MGLFKADLFRSLALGFVLGAAAFGAVMSIHGNDPLAGQMISQAQATPVLVDQTR